MYPHATLCPNCSYHWTLVPAVKRSWRCPICATHRTAETEKYVCACDHSYGEHDTYRELENSQEAFSLPGDAATADVIAALPKRARAPNPAIGACESCACKEYRRKPLKALGTASAAKLAQAHDLLYGIPDTQRLPDDKCDDGLVFITRLRAQSLSRTWYAIDTSKTWKDFRDSMPADTYEENMALSFDDDNLPRPSDDDAFDYERVSWDNEWPSNPWDDMEQLLPPAVLQLGGVAGMFSFFVISSSEEDKALQLLHAAGFRTERDDDLIAKACGHWNGAHVFS